MTHDSLAEAATELGNKVAYGDLLKPYLMLDDNEFVVTRSMITSGKVDSFNFEQISIKSNNECAVEELIRPSGILWMAIEMAFNKIAAVIGFCIGMHNYCTDVLLDLSDELKKKEVFIEVVTGIKRLALMLRDRSTPLDGLANDFHCASCGQGVRSPVRSHASRRTELETEIQNAGLARPYR